MITILKRIFKENKNNKAEDVDKKAEEIEKIKKAREILEKNLALTCQQPHRLIINKIKKL